MISRESQSMPSRRTSSESGESLAKLNHSIEVVAHLDSREEVMMMIGIKEVQEISTINHLILTDFRIREVLAISHNSLQTNLVIGERITNLAETKMMEVDRGTTPTISHTSTTFPSKDSPSKI